MRNTHTPTRNVLEITSLSKNFKAFSLKQITFNVPQGYIMGFIGPNGAGKSTTIKLVMNLLRKDAGQIKVFGLDHIESEKEIKDRIGFVFDENYYYDELSIAQVVKIIAPFYSRWDQTAFDKHLKNFGMFPKIKIKELSKGMKMKFSLAVALSHHADLLIMDEPTGGLDPIVRSELLEILTDLIQDEGKSVFFSTHITTDLDKIADYITFIHDGELVFSATKDDILDQYGIVKGDKQLLDREVEKLFVGLRTNQFGFEGLVRDKALARRTFKDRALLEKPTLEDIMLYTVRGEKNVYAHS
ncbi:ABC transporter ATP-binding protein [Paradesulfitobacterium aromaticivorans]